MRRRLVAVTAGMVALVAIPALVHALPVGLSLGPAKAFGDGSSSVRLGVSPALQVIMPATPALSIGFRLAYTYFPLKLDDVDTIGSGSTDILELVPWLRLHTAKSVGANWFGQAGLGLYRAHSSIRFESRQPGLLDQTEVKGSVTKPGLLLGAGVSLGHGATRFELGPLFQIVFTDVSSTKYLIFAGTVTFGN